jgi:hypothetical protein
MSTISLLNAGLLPTLTPTENTVSAAEASSMPQMQIVGSTIVTIPSGGESPLLYTPAGTLTGADPTITWAQDNSDAVSKVMGTDFLARTMSGQFSNLGSALLDRFKTTDSSFSQSVSLGDGNTASTGSASNSSGATNVTGSSGSGPQGDIELTVKTVTGVTVNIDMDSENGTLSVTENSSGSLSDGERTALSNLASGFQQAIDGLTANPPQINLSGLSQYDSTELSSVSLQVNVTNDGQNNISANIGLDSSAKSVQVTDASGSINLSVNTSDSAIWGSQSQRDQAIASYLQQFDEANAKGHGNSQLMSMFKDAFAQMNGDYGTPSQSQQLPGTAGETTIGQADQAMLTGLADFTASITDTPVQSNPLLPNQTDNFAYQVSQTTKVQGGPLQGNISQTQQSSLQAAYHESLTGGPVTLGKSKAQQNYDYVLINDQASSTVNIATNGNKILSATLNQSTNQSTEVQKFEQAVKVSDVTTPKKTSESVDLLKLLKPLMDDGQARTDTSAWQQALSNIHGMILLNADEGPATGSSADSSNSSNSSNSGTDSDTNSSSN